jgi:hypothetical protein
MENEAALAIPDAFPVTEGHTLVVPRRHVAGLFSLPDEELAALWRLVGLVRAGLLHALMNNRLSDKGEQLRAAEAIARIEMQRARLLNLTKPAGTTVNVNVPPPPAPEPPAHNALEGATTSELLQIRDIMARIRQRREAALATPPGVLVIDRVRDAAPGGQP